MSSLWTPDGEHEVDRLGEPDPPLEQPIEDFDDDGAELDPGVAAEMADLERKLIEAPIEEVVANHCYGLFQLAALHLGQHPPNLDAARLAIDALGAIVDTLDTRLGQAAPTLRDGLAQLRLAFVQIAAVTNAAEAPPGI